ncbi:unnamed protein product [Pedinophyceae sp. YPF-701]|nr:unnamed protein product [Pedinophyceae sp. YPF-701]
MNFHAHCPMYHVASPRLPFRAFARPQLAHGRVAPRDDGSVARRAVSRHAYPRRRPSRDRGAVAARVAAPPSPPAEAVGLQEELCRLRDLREALLRARDRESKVALLRQAPRVLAFGRTKRGQEVQAAARRVSLDAEYAVLLVVAMGQAHVLEAPARGAPGPASALADALEALTGVVVAAERFYDSIGGIVGYQIKALEIIAGDGDDEDANGAGQPDASDIVLHCPAGPDLSSEGNSDLKRKMAAEGLRGLPRMAEIYPVGGAGDRLGLTCNVTGEPLPTAVLPYCGRPLLEGLVRDLQAREFLHFCVTGAQATTPVAVMTSEAKGNHSRIRGLFESRAWFGRGPDAFRLFRQPMVPVLAADDGRWLLGGAVRPLLKPGGHGAIWKLMHDEGVFEWLERAGREGAVVRQISNPLAGTDATLLALSGAGLHGQKTLGFASCERAVGAAEGMNVLAERRVRGADGREVFEYGVTNIEYTEFDRLGVEDSAHEDDEDSGLSRFPANTNVMFLSLAAARGAVEDGIRSGGGATLPGMIFNRGKQVEHVCERTGQPAVSRGGRIECTMQNIADSLVQAFPQRRSPEEFEQLETFVVYNKRRRVTSSAKRKRRPGDKHIHQTPDGSFVDLMTNAHEVLTAYCGMTLPPAPTAAGYLKNGPPFIVLMHPALGPLWEVIGQKIRGGSMAEGSEMVLEIADVWVTDLNIDGSLLVEADAVMGHTEPGPDGFERLVYSARNGRCRMHNVTVENRGFVLGDPANIYWAHRLVRRESCRFLLRGRAEVDARDVTIRGSHAFEVPDGHRLLIRPPADDSEADRARGFSVRMERMDDAQAPSWQWRHELLPDDSIELTPLEA